MFSDPLFHFIPTNAQSVTILNCEVGNHKRGHCFGGGSNGKPIQLMTSHKHETKVDNGPEETDQCMCTKPLTFDMMKVGHT